MNRFVFLGVVCLVAMSAAWVLPRLERPLSPLTVAQDLIEQGRGAEAVHLLEDENWRGIAEYRAGRYRRAAIEFVQVEDATALYNLGNAYARLGEWKGARAAYERALYLAPDDEDAAFNLSLVLQAEERQQEEADKQRRTRTVGAEDSAFENSDETGSTEGQTKDDETAKPSDSATPTERSANRSGQIASRGRDGETSQLQDQAAGRGTMTESAERATADQFGAAATAILRKSTQDAEIILRKIADDPARVLRARLYTIHKLRTEENQ